MRIGFLMDPLENVRVDHDSTFALMLECRRRGLEVRELRQEWLYVADGRAREAIPYFDAALQISPDYYEAQLNRAIALQVAGDPAAAAAELQRLLARLPESREYTPQRVAARTLFNKLSQQFRR